MTWTYDPEQLETNEVYQARFLIGDIDTTDQLVADEEITWVLSQHPNVYEASASLAESLAAKFAREVNITVDGMSYSADQLSNHYRALAEALRAEADKVHRLGLPYVGGISWKERAEADADADLIRTSFRSHMHDHPQTGSADKLKSDQS